MPCDGVAVLRMKQRQAQARQDQGEVVAEMLNQHKVVFWREVEGKEGRDPDIIKFHLQTKPAMSLAVGPGAQVTAITRDGTFKVGRETLLQLMAKLKEAGLDLQQLGAIEQHVHTPEGNAPQQAYAQSKN